MKMEEVRRSLIETRKVLEDLREALGIPVLRRRFREMTPQLSPSVETPTQKTERVVVEQPTEERQEIVERPVQILNFPIRNAIANFIHSLGEVAKRKVEIEEKRVEQAQEKEKFEYRSLRG